MLSQTTVLRQNTMNIYACLKSILFLLLSYFIMFSCVHAQELATKDVDEKAASLFWNNPYKIYGYNLNCGFRSDAEGRIVSGGDE